MNKLNISTSRTNEFTKGVTSAHFCSAASDARRDMVDKKEILASVVNKFSPYLTISKEATVPAKLLKDIITLQRFDISYSRALAVDY